LLAAAETETLFGSSICYIKYAQKSLQDTGLKLCSSKSFCHLDAEMASLLAKCLEAREVQQYSQSPYEKEQA